MATQIVVPMVPDRFGGDRIALPVVGVRMLRAGSQLGPRCHALVDTGSAYTLANLDIATLLGITPEDLARGPAARVGGVGGDVAEARGARLDLVIGASRGGSMSLPEAWVYFTPARLPAGLDVLLDQRDVLERLTLVQRNHDATPRFVLRLPSTR